MFKTPTKTSNNVKHITFAALGLRNFLRETSKDTYTPPVMVDREDVANAKIHLGQWHQLSHAGLEGLQPVSRGHINDAKLVRDNLREYFNSEGRVSWQDEMALVH